MQHEINVSEIVQTVGGPAEMARLCDMKNSQAISNWVARNKIPKARLTYLKVVRPELFRKYRAA